VSRRLVNITLDTLKDLPPRCRQCVFWELEPLGWERAEAVRRASIERSEARSELAIGDPALEKEAWVSATLLEWGSCGKLAYVDGVPAGYAMFAPPAYAPRSVAFPSSPVSADAALLMVMYVLPEFTSSGLGRMLVQGVAKDLARRGLRAIEAFGDLQWDGPACVIPAEHLLAVGFKTVRPHPRYPRLRLELKSAVSWREDVEVALERLLGSMSPDRALRPI